MDKKYRIKVECTLDKDPMEYITEHNISDNEPYEYTTIRWERLKKHQMNRARLYKKAMALKIVSDLQEQENASAAINYAYTYTAEPVYML